MSKLTVELSDSLRTKALYLAEQSGISLEEFIEQAITAKIAAVEKGVYFAERARRGNRADFDAVLAKVPDSTPDDEDRLEPR
jgi:hypothetical protein